MYGVLHSHHTVFHRGDTIWQFPEHSNIPDLLILPDVFIFSLGDPGHPAGCDIEFQRGLDCISLKVVDVEYLSILLTVIFGKLYSVMMAVDAQNNGFNVVQFIFSVRAKKMPNHELPPCFSSKNFAFLAIIYCYWFHFMYMAYARGSVLLFSCMWIFSSPETFVEKTVVFHWAVWTPSSKVIWLHMWRFMSEPAIPFHWPICLSLCHCHTFSIALQCIL